MHKPRLTEPMKRVIRHLGMNANIAEYHWSNNPRARRCFSVCLWPPGDFYHGVWNSTFYALQRRALIERAGKPVTIEERIILRWWRLSGRGRQVAKELKREQPKAD